MENIWGSQRKTANMERGGLREENRRAHEEDERFRMTAVKAAGQVRQRMRCATGESDEVIRRKFMLPERYILTLMTVETLGQERMLLDLMAGGRLGADLVLCGRRSFYADMLLRTARDRRLALRMFSPRRAIAVSSCCLDPHLTPYFLNLRLQLELLYRTRHDTKTIRPSRCFFRVKCDTFMMISIESQI